MENQKILIEKSIFNQCQLCNKVIDNIFEITFSYNKDNNIYICKDCLQEFNESIKKILAKDDLELDILSIDSEYKKYSQELIDTIYLWLDYKKKKWKKEYTDRGIKTLLSEIKNQISATSENVVICKINNSINNKWQGIIWESNKFLENDIVNFFEKTWNDLVNINTSNKEEAKKKYLWLFRKISNLETAKTFANKIYIYYKNYISNLSDEKYCMTFANFLVRNIPEYQEK